MRARWYIAGFLFSAVAACGEVAHIDARYLVSEPSDAGSRDTGALPDVGVRDGLADRGVDAADEQADANDATGSTDTTDATDATDATDGADDTNALEAGDAPTSPPPIASSHLRLWLTANAGVTCAQVMEADSGVRARVASWADQSGHGNNATLQHGQLGPQCSRTASPHGIGGVEFPYFSAPQNGNIVDETLDVDLSFLANSNYTVFAVERRWADYQDGDSLGMEQVLGTTMRPDIEAQNPTQCGIYPADLMLGFGYRYGDGAAFVFDQWCDDEIVVPIARVSNTPPTSLTEETAMFDESRGHELWINGTPVAANANQHPLVYAGGGAIGRALVETTLSHQDPRFRGDIAEVLVYDSALEDVDRLREESNLQQHWSY